MLSESMGTQTCEGKEKKNLKALNNGFLSTTCKLWREERARKKEKREREKEQRKRERKTLFCIKNR